MTYVRTLTILMRVNTGSPTWWKPDLSTRRTASGLLIVRAGWLRMCVQIAIGTKRHYEEDEEA